MEKTVLVTGGTRGIGRAISERLSKVGYTVVANYAGNDAAAQACAEELGIKTIKFCVGDFEACHKGVREIEDSIGPVDILVNNAGITRDAMLHKMTPDMWNEVIRVDLTSAFNLSHAVIDRMRDAGWGRIINISSINGQKGQMGQTNYSAAKAGLIGFTKALAQETARKGITVNAVCPGYTDTDMVAAVPQNVLDGIVSNIPVGRLGKSDEIAACVAFLASEEAAFITGASLAVNGGQYIPT